MATRAWRSVQDVRTSTKTAHQNADGSVVLIVGRDGTLSQPAPRGGRLDCAVHDLRPDTVQFAVGDVATDLQENVGYWLLCDDAGGQQVVSRLFFYAPGVSVLSAGDLAARARDELPLVYPEPHTSPAITRDQMVGIDTWMWLDPAAWQPLTATAAIAGVGGGPGLSVTATATPQSVTWDMGDGTVVTCDGPGTPYDDARPEATQHTDCRHTYQSRAAYDATATITWSISWTASDGTGGQLADASRTTQFPMTVAERQAVAR